MSREIKLQFVFKRKDGSVVISPDFTVDKLLESFIEDIESSCSLCKCQPIGETNVIDCNCSDEELELIATRQYAGLKDKYKKEIYEGDIVICILNGNAIGASDTVTFKNGSFWLNRRNIPISEWYDKDNAEFEVIGNIYQP